MVILVDKGILFWVSIKDGLGVIMDPDLDNIPGGTESLLGKPDSSKFKNDITSLLGLDSLKINELLLCVEHPGHIETITRKCVSVEVRLVGSLDDPL